MGVIANRFRLRSLSVVAVCSLLDDLASVAFEFI